ncbi:MAG: dihydropteroate synthase [Prolixibacteraceae bacterium]|jgi:dihydropteroate synthase|nr:dihydropteroate synthase [Prolixibacteraceae bacterium]
MIISTSDKKYFQKKSLINYNGSLYDLSIPRVMGILNVTPDSFYDGGRYSHIGTAIERVGQMLGEGADIIDVGACSTRPGAVMPDADEELSRLMPVIGEIKRLYPEAVLSVDTFRASVVSALVNKFGCIIVNDISAGGIDSEMFRTVAGLNVPYILMHMRGTPETMQNNPSYKNVTKEVVKELSVNLNKLYALGVNDVVIDPGFGFAKTIDHNYELFNHLDAFRFFEIPLLVGVSRKSMLYKFLGGTPDDALNATTVLNTLALQAGANILRVHDVKPAVEAVAVYNKLKEFAQ